MANRYRYQEKLIQWIWENLEFDVNKLETTEGEPIKIISQGTKNSSEGPDFLNASLLIGDIEWHGSIEIHVDARDWESHQHHYDELFNGVILHVVLENPDHRILTKSGATPKTIHLKQFLNRNLSELLKQKSEKQLPCGGQVSFINQKAFESQVEKAHKEYFEYKVNELNKLYNPKLTPSEAWKCSFLKQLYSALGIPSNQSQMQQLFENVYTANQNLKSRDEFISAVNDVAFKEIAGQKIIWVSGGVRPLNSAPVRVKQAAAYHHAIGSISMKEFLKTGVRSWEKVESLVPDEFIVGKQRTQILEGTVFLPAIYYLGALFHDEKLKKSSLEIWKREHFGVPQKILKPFREAGFSIHSDMKKLGLAHQYKRYCLRKECHRCKVFKSAIRS